MRTPEQTAAMMGRFWAQYEANWGKLQIGTEAQGVIGSWAMRQSERYLLAAVDILGDEEAAGTLRGQPRLPQLRRALRRAYEANPPDTRDGAQQRAVLPYCESCRASGWVYCVCRTKRQGEVGVLNGLVPIDRPETLGAQERAYPMLVPCSCHAGVLALRSMQPQPRPGQLEACRRATFATAGDAMDWFHGRTQVSPQTATAAPAVEDDAISF